MKCIYTDLYEKFRCVGGACPDSCCSKGWTITIDDSTLKKYDDIDGDFGKEIRACIEKRAGINFIKLDEKGRCPFLNDKNLCEICIKLSSEYLSYTCDNYPRKFIECEDIVSVTTMASCPEVARMLINMKEPLRLGFVDDGVQNKSIQNQARYNVVFDGLVATINVISAHEISFRSRLYAALTLNKYISDSLKYDTELEQADCIINEFVENWMLDNEFFDGINDEEVSGVWSFLYDLLDALGKINGLIASFGGFAYRCKRIDRNEEELFWKLKEKVHSAYGEYVIENILINYIFSLYMGAYSSKEDVFELVMKGIMFISVVDVMQCAHLLDNKRLTKEDMSLIISKTATFFDNTNAFSILLKRIESVNNENIIKQMIYLV